jgi:ABC-type branched-subunit amino acid transport system ATPase component
VHQALTICDKFAVIERGSVVASGSAYNKAHREKLLAAIAV